MIYGILGMLKKKASWGVATWVWGKAVTCSDAGWGHSSGECPEDNWVQVSFPYHATGRRTWPQGSCLTPPTYHPVTIPLPDAWAGSIWYQQSPVCISQVTPFCQASLRKTPATLCHSQVKWVSSPTDSGNARSHHSGTASLFDGSCVDACKWFNYPNLCKCEVKLKPVCPL